MIFNHTPARSIRALKAAGLTVLIACFLLQSLIPKGYMPGNLAPGDGTGKNTAASLLVFCGDTAFLSHSGPDVSELLNDADTAASSAESNNSPDNLYHHDHLPHNNPIPGHLDHCLFAFGGLSDPASIFALLTVYSSGESGTPPVNPEWVPPTCKAHFRPPLRAPPLAGEWVLSS